MLRTLLQQGCCERQPYIYQVCSLFSLSTEMSKKAPSNVYQICGSDNRAIAKAVTLLKKGEIIALPTDTVYGLAADASNLSAIKKLYEVKGRDEKKPLAICLATVLDVKNWGITSDLPKGLLRALLPGPVTILLNRTEKLNPDLNPGIQKVGIRVPSTPWHPFVQFVAGANGYPLALTSANLSNEPNCICADEFKHLWPKLAAVYDCSVNKPFYKTASREASTIVDLTEPGAFRVTRVGAGYNETVQTLNKFGLKELCQ